MLTSALWVSLNLGDIIIVLAFVIDIYFVTFQLTRQHALWVATLLPSLLPPQVDSTSTWSLLPSAMDSSPPGTILLLPTICSRLQVLHSRSVEAQSGSTAVQPCRQQQDNHCDG